jgi:hypothetical protein
VGAGEEVVPASEYRAVQSQVRELQRLLGKKTLENEKEPLPVRLFRGNYNNSAFEILVWPAKKIALYVSKFQM